MEVAEGVAAFQVAQAALQVIATLNLTTYLYPDQYNAHDGTMFDYVIVGAGSAGSVIANRLTETKGCSVLLIEAGDNPALENLIPRLFLTASKSRMDWNFTADNEGHTARYYRYPSLPLAAGKVLGGSSSLSYFYYMRGVPNDYTSWVDATKDHSFSWDNLLPYFKKSERLVDPLVHKYRPYFGVEGPIGLTRDANEKLLKYLHAFHEVGNKIVDDVNVGGPYGYAQPPVYIYHGRSQSAAMTYLSPIKTRPNLYVMKNSEVCKIIFDNRKHARGVEVVTPEGRKINIYAKNEVIVSAGVFNTPKLLMLSGIGPKTDLEKLGIDVIADLPVGMNFQDQMAVMIVHKMEHINEPPPAESVGRHPNPTFVGYSALNKNQLYPDYVTFNLIEKNNPSALLQLCALLFSFNDEACEELVNAGKRREILFTGLSKTRPHSRGSVSLRSNNYKDPPIIKTGYLTDHRDLIDYAHYAKDFVRVSQSSVFKNINAETHYFKLPFCDTFPKNSMEYWKCYVRTVSSTYCSFCCTSPMGTVLDSKLLVKGVHNLRVVDASAMPKLTSGTLNAPITALAEKAADMIKAHNSF